MENFIGAFTVFERILKSLVEKFLEGFVALLSIQLCHCWREKMIVVVHQQRRRRPCLVDEQVFQVLLHFIGFHHEIVRL
jgi:hypothetical protein